MKKLALKIMDAFGRRLPVMKKKDIEDAIREMADEDDGFEDLVFELGCSKLAKYIKKRAQESTVIW